jgi:hypothetical protein
MVCCARLLIVIYRKVDAGSSPAHGANLNGVRCIWLHAELLPRRWQVQALRPQPLSSFDICGLVV